MVMKPVQWLAKLLFELIVAVFNGFSLKKKRPDCCRDALCVLCFFNLQQISPAGLYRW